MSRTSEGMFNFRSASPLVETVNSLLGAAQNVLILGGGRGLLGQLLKQRRQGRVLNTDLVPMREPLVETVPLNMEDAFTREGLGLRGSLSILLPFSFEYVDRRVAARNIARALLPGEVCVLVCHLKESLIVEQIGRRDSQLCGIARRIFAAATMGGEGGRRMLVEAEREFVQLCPNVHGFPMMEKDTEVAVRILTAHGQSIDTGIVAEITLELLFARFIVEGIGSAHFPLLKKMYARTIGTEPFHTTLRDQAMANPEEVASFFPREMVLEKKGSYVFSNSIDPRHAMVLHLRKQ